MREELVERRQWLTPEAFGEWMALTQLIPGPSSTEMAMAMGYVRGGWRGLVLAGLSFILPAALVVGGLSELYLHQVPLTWWMALLGGIHPVVLAQVVEALGRLAPTTLRGRAGQLLAAAVAALSGLGVREVPLVLAAGLLTAVLGWRSAQAPSRWRLLGLAGGLGSLALLAQLAVGTAWHGRATPLTVFAEFLKIGGTLYGSGYVLLAYLQSDLVQALGWLTPQQVLDTVAVGQMTPGPVFTGATFAGALVGGWPGAVAATVGIFLPGFLFCGGLCAFRQELLRDPLCSAFLQGVQAAAWGLMASVLFRLGPTACGDAPTLVWAGIALALLWWRKLSSGWLLLVGAGLGCLRTGLLGFAQ